MGIEMSCVGSDVLASFLYPFKYAMLAFDYVKRGCGPTDQGTRLRTVRSEFDSLHPRQKPAKIPRHEGRVMQRYCRPVQD